MLEIEDAEHLAVEVEVERDIQAMNPDDKDMEVWEMELDDGVANPQQDIKLWSELQMQIQHDIKNGCKTLPVGHLNQLMILFNFATLMMKGYPHMEASQWISVAWNGTTGYWFGCWVRELARYYKIFKQLPIEHQVLQGSCTVPLELGNSGRELRCEGCLDIGFSSFTVPTFYCRSRYFQWGREVTS